MVRKNNIVQPDSNSKCRASPNSNLVLMMMMEFHDPPFGNTLNSNSQLVAGSRAFFDAVEVDFERHIEDTLLLPCHLV